MQAPPPFAPAPPTARRLATAQLGTGTIYAVDVTDVARPVTISTLEWSTEPPRLVSPDEVSWLWNDSGMGTRLYRSNFVTHAKTMVATCVLLYGWSPDGTTLTYVSPGATRSIDQLRQLSGGRNVLLGAMQLPSAGCGGQSCEDDYQYMMEYSPDGRYIAIVDGGAGAPSLLRVVSPTGGTLFDEQAHLSTMAVWSGDNLYYRDDRGVEVLRGSAPILVAPGVRWFTPHAAPAGDRIVFAVRDAQGLPHVEVMDVATGAIRALAAGGDHPKFLSSRYVFYRGICVPAASCGVDSDGSTGKGYVYDLQTATVTETAISWVADVWPHAA